MLDFERNIKDFRKRNIGVAAASADKWEDALKTAERYKLTFPVGWGLDPARFSQQTGAFYNDKENYIQATGFIISPEGKVENAVYSSRSIGRLMAKDCLSFVGH